MMNDCKECINYKNCSLLTKYQRAALYDYFEGVFDQLLEHNDCFESNNSEVDSYEIK